MSPAAIYVSAAGGLLFLAGIGTLALHRLSGGPQEQGTTFRTGLVLVGAGLVTLLVGAVMIFAWIFGD